MRAIVLSTTREFMPSEHDLTNALKQQVMIFQFSDADNAMREFKFMYDTHFITVESKIVYVAGPEAAKLKMLLQQDYPDLEVLPITLEGHTKKIPPRWPMLP